MILNAICIRKITWIVGIFANQSLLNRKFRIYQYEIIISLTFSKNRRMIRNHTEALLARPLYALHKNLYFISYDIHKDS